MDEHLIIETNTTDKAAEKELETHLARVAKYQAEGYYCEEQENGDWWIYPKNALTGETDMNAMPTKLWSEIKQTPDETYEFPVATDVEPEYSGVFETDYTIRPRPPEWTEGYSGDDFNSQFDAGEFDV